MSALITGSVAYDVIMVFKDRFANHILPDKVHMLSVSFLVPELRREFGGCAGNVAYNLNLLGGQGEILASVGEDFGPYAEWLKNQGISTRLIQTIPNTYTAQAYITSDLDDNQITAFHPGAMSFSADLAVPQSDGFKLALLAPDSREGMITHAAQLAEAGIPFIFDPGQAMPLFNGEEFLWFLERATWAALNDYEFGLLQARTGLTAEALASRVEALIVTCGGDGSRIYTEGQILEIPVAQASELTDPTGCGDAYRAGLLYGLMEDYDWDTTARIAALLGAIKIEKPGTQNHRFTRDEFRERFRKEFGYVF